MIIDNKWGSLDVSYTIRAAHEDKLAYMKCDNLFINHAYSGSFADVIDMVFIESGLYLIKEDCVIRFHEQDKVIYYLENIKKLLFYNGVELFYETNNFVVRKTNTNFKVELNEEWIFNHAIYNYYLRDGIYYQKDGLIILKCEHLLVDDHLFLITPLNTLVICPDNRGAIMISFDLGAVECVASDDQTVEIKCNLATFFLNKKQLSCQVPMSMPNTSRFIKSATSL